MDSHDLPTRTWEVEAGGSGIQRHLQLHSDLEASLGFLQVGKKKTEALSGLVTTPKSLPICGRAHPLQSLAS